MDKLVHGQLLYRRKACPLWRREYLEIVSSMLYKKQQTPYTQKTIIDQKTCAIADNRDKSIVYTNMAGL